MQDLILRSFLSSNESQRSILLSHFHISLRSHKIRECNQTEKGQFQTRVMRKITLPFNKSERGECKESKEMEKKVRKRDGHAGRQNLFCIVNEWQSTLQIYGRSGVPVQQ